jgi:hypothetical protein
MVLFVYVYASKSLYLRKTSSLGDPRPRDFVGYSVGERFLEAALSLGNHITWLSP